MRETEGCRIHH